MSSANWYNQLQSGSFSFFMLSFSIVTALGQAPPKIAQNFPQPLATEKYLSSRGGPNLADIDGDGDWDIVTASGKMVYVFNSDGRALAGWPQATMYETRESPASGDLNGDGKLEIVTIDLDAPTGRGFLYAWNNYGELLAGFPVLLPEAGVVSVTLYDLDQNSTVEIICGLEAKVFVFQHDGTIAPGWPKDISPFAPIAKAAVGDLNGDGEAEIVLPGQYAADRFEDYQGRLYVWNARGEYLPGWPVTLPSGYTFAGGCDPTLADVNGDGLLEVAIGTFNPVAATGFAALYRYDGSMMPGWPQYLADGDSLVGFQAGAAAADIDRDGAPELIFGDLFDHIVAWKGDGSVVEGWPIILGEIDPTLIARSTYISPGVGDVDGDGHLDIFVSNNQTDLINSGWFGRIYVFNDKGTQLPWSPLRPKQSATSRAVAMGDLNCDGSVELAAVSVGRKEINGPKETWLTVWQIPGVPYVHERFPWPMYGHDRWHTSQYGFVPPDEPVVRVADRNQPGAPPTAFALEQNYPNPFVLSQNATGHFTAIRFALPEAAQVQLRLFDILGAEVKTWAVMKPAGVHEFRWNGRDNRGQPLPGGVYFYRLEAVSAARHVVLTKKLLLLR
ncbi:MAG: FG-GAP-like repeat-containing protein [candidate division KSB1 bacterium]|nr:FG-GAP-like repeat-containing protein [candidate division KSB1 bacterium]MDZ7275776.1 FG-GAP-like repeat-containing protein [candidate division KSB1 bacterium]MDZ7287529.1 FG-GAP-like repeat-containing protein [candidate division KSB1 bacterium]MDZ7309141.1 FG-GAP-like repeat-containing protein [candidate division KSB1 bacterium]MDZ7350507.1 FG-GAP-like repeat-containing protein [candidate division KSB1 bacterium]